MTALLAWIAEVDAALGLRPLAPSRERGYREAGRAALEGRWLGAYTQPSISWGPGWMSLNLMWSAADAERALWGEGRDKIGRFTMTAAWDGVAETVRIVKRYLGAHRVSYVGALGDSSLHGIWQIERTFGLFGLYRADALAPSARARAERAAARGSLPGAALLTELSRPLRAHAIRRDHRLAGRFEELFPGSFHAA